MRDLPPYRPPRGPLQCLHEDEAILVFNKPAGLLSVPGKTEPDCLEARVQARYPDALTVHRLDMATSGIVVMARGKPALAHIGLQFEKRQTKKRYVALVCGEVPDDSGTVDLPIRCDWPNRPLQMICHEHGRSAVTHWQVIAREDGRTRLALTPVTGRSHQLRLHMKALGHPILGDEWYADEDAASAALRLLLHAESLTFRHPASEAEMTFTAPAPF
jgi:tRNA pseudouridine32 synthase/23S rRNA pseudouridine746 synthase